MLFVFQDWVGKLWQSRGDFSESGYVQPHINELSFFRFFLKIPRPRAFP